MFSGLAPDRAGCNAKLSFQTTHHLEKILFPKQSKRGDYSVHEMDNGTEIITSIDKIGRFCNDLSLFSKAALAHCLRDINAAGAKCINVDICFEFGADLSSYAGYSELVSEVYDACKFFSVNVGKCHSIQSPLTALTISCYGFRNKCNFDFVTEGDVILTSPVGAFRTVFLSEQGHDVNNLALARASMLDDYSWLTSRQLGVVRMADVSGFGLAGALSTLAMQEGCGMQIHISDDVLLNKNIAPIQCIHADLPDNVVVTSEGIETILTLREVAGPLIILVEHDANDVIRALQMNGYSPIQLGTFSKGNVEVRVDWK